MNFDPETYTLSIKKEFLEEQWIYVGRVAEFPNLIAFEDSFESARTMLINSLIGLKKISDRNNENFPRPNIAYRDEYNGRITLRIAKTLHAKIAHLAKQDDVSLNTFLVSAISEYVGIKKAAAATAIVNPNLGWFLDNSHVLAAKQVTRGLATTINILPQPTKGVPALLEEPFEMNSDYCFLRP